MPPDQAEQIKDLLETLDSDNVNDRTAALKMLRERLALTNKELSALVIAVGKLKRKLGVK